MLHSCAQPTGTGEEEENREREREIQNLTELSKLLQLPLSETLNQ